MWCTGLIAFGVLACAAAWYGAWSYAKTHEFKVVFLNVGQGDGTLIQFRNGQKMLVDCGPNAGVLARLGAELPFYDRTIDYVLATHPDLDHYGGCVDVVKRYKVSEIITNGKSKENDPYWQTWNAVQKESGAKLVTITSPLVWHIASTTFEFLSPDPALQFAAAADDSNNYSIVFRLLDPTDSYLFTADMEVPLEQALLKRYCTTAASTTFAYPCPRLQSHVLKVGHHGSKSSSGSELLEAVVPKTAVISVGPNKYGHPSLRVIKRLERAGAAILRTDMMGDILVK